MIEIAKTVPVIEQLNEIRNKGTSFWKTGDGEKAELPRMGFNHNNTLVCSDGFSVSVTAGWGVRSTPSPGWGGCPEDYSGPYDSFEVGNPTEKPEPWGLWKLFCENGDKATESKYFYVPYVMVEQLLLDHEGFVGVGIPARERDPDPFSFGEENDRLPITEWETRPIEKVKLPVRSNVEKTGMHDGRTPRKGLLYNGSRLLVDESLPKPGGGVERFYSV